MAPLLRGMVLPLCLALLGPVAFGESATIRAVLQSPSGRKPAPGFRLADGSGRMVSLSKYNGHVVLLDFWATECGGCREEIPWFMEFDRVYRSKGLDVVGVSMDVPYEQLKSVDEAWMKVKPFVREKMLKYTILMADDPVVKSYDLMALPATFLIDKKGRIAASYLGLVNKQNIEENVRALLSER